MDSEKGSTVAGQKSSQSLELEVVSFVQERREFRAGSHRIEPRVAQHSLMTEKTVVNGAGQHIQRSRFLSQVTELPRQIIRQALG
jgi:hypothetical protein